jgi:putative acetyltransferase
LPNVTIERIAAPTAEAALLVNGLDDVLNAGYEPEQRHGLSLDQLFQPHIRFFVARVNGEPAGCGAVVLFDDFAEVKRMYTRDAVRGRGVGKAILARLEREARDAGKSLLRLETGVDQTAAIGLYERCGFVKCGPFGHYADLEPHRIAASLLYEKGL